MQDVLPDLNQVVKSNREEESVKGRMVQLAQGNAIGYNRFTIRISVGKNVRGVQQFVMLEAAKGALLPIRVNYSFAKCCLMNAASHGCCYISTSNISDHVLSLRGQVDAGS